jgi:hypothetical protein
MPGSVTGTRSSRLVGRGKIPGIDGKFPGPTIDCLRGDRSFILKRQRRDGSGL